MIGLGSGFGTRVVPTRRRWIGHRAAPNLGQRAAEPNGCAGGGRHIQHNELLLRNQDPHHKRQAEGRFVPQSGSDSPRLLRSPTEEAKQVPLRPKGDTSNKSPQIESRAEKKSDASSERQGAPRRAEEGNIAGCISRQTESSTERGGGAFALGTEGRCFHARSISCRAKQGIERATKGRSSARAEEAGPSRRPGHEPTDPLLPLLLQARRGAAAQCRPRGDSADPKRPHPPLEVRRNPPRASRTLDGDSRGMDVPGEPARQIRVAPDKGGRVRGVDQPTTGPGRVGE